MSRTTQECPRCGLTFQAKAKTKVKPANGNAGYLCGLKDALCDYRRGKECIYKLACTEKKERKL
jgi:hypothetical protein